MKDKNYIKKISFILLLFSFSLLAQNSEVYSIPSERKGKLFFKIGSEYRLTPAYLVPGSSINNQLGFYTNVDILHNGMALSYGVEYFLSKSLSFSVVNSLRYKPFLYPFRTIESNFGAEKAEATLLLGFHGYLDYHIPLFKESELFLRLGISTYNGGSEFVIKQTVFNSDGEPEFASSGDASFKNTGYNFALGYSKNRIKLLAGVYTSEGGTFFTSSFNIFTPYIKLDYVLGKL